MEGKYILATNCFVASGKDNYTGFKKGKIVAPNIELDIYLLENYLLSFTEPINIGMEGRIIN